MIVPVTLPLSREAIDEILAIASRAPSGVNSQPWQLLFLPGQRAAEAVQLVSQHADALLATTEAATFRECGSLWPLSDRGAPGASAYDDAELLEQFRALEAPLAALCLFDVRLGHGSQLDDGMFLQSIVLLARPRGIRVRVLPAWQLATPVLREPLAIEENCVVLCGLAFDDKANAPADVDAGQPGIIWRE
jgi:nitroreductase